MRGDRLDAGSVSVSVGRRTRGERLDVGSASVCVGGEDGRGQT